LSDHGGSIGYSSGDRLVESQYFTLTLGATFKAQTTYKIVLDELQDLAGNVTTGVQTFTTSHDAIAPVNFYADSFTNGQAGFSVEKNITFRALETLKLGTHGSIDLQLRSNTDAHAVVEHFDVARASLNAATGVYTIQGQKWVSGAWVDTTSVLTLDNKTISINPSYALNYGATYEVLFRPETISVTNNATPPVTTTTTYYPVSDLSGNFVASNNALATPGSSLYFTTATNLTAVSGSLVSQSLSVGLEDSLTMTFSEAVKAGAAGSKIALYNASGTLFETFTISGNGATGDHNGAITFNGATMTINPGPTLDRASGYYITIGSTGTNGQAGYTSAIQAAQNKADGTQKYFYTDYMASYVVDDPAHSTPYRFSSEAAAQVDPGFNSSYVTQTNEFDYNATNNAQGQQAGLQVEAVGDVDGDGIVDYIFGSPNWVNDASIPTAGNSAKGLFYLVFGKAGQWPDLQTIGDLKAEGRVVTFYGTQMNQLMRATEFGDLNHDGYNDLLLLAGGQNPIVTDNTASDLADTDSGAAFVVYGKARNQWDTTLSTDNLGSDGLAITGGLPQDEFAFSGASGDFNGDGTIDMVMGMPTNQRDGYNSGEGFVINGGDYSDSLIQTGTSGNDLLLGDFNANRLAGGAGNDTIHGLGGADILRGGGGDDVLSITKLDFIMIDGGTGNDTLQFIGHGMDLDMTGFAGASLRSLELPRNRVPAGAPAVHGLWHQHLADHQWHGRELPDLGRPLGHHGQRRYLGHVCLGRYLRQGQSRHSDGLDRLGHSLPRRHDRL
jgi:hypothetical protein